LIFVATGTTYAFDPIIKKMDEIASCLGEEVIIQTGVSKYKPKNCKYFEFESNLMPYFKKASLVIAHGGAGSSFEILTMGKKLISVENLEVNDKHQSDLLRELDRLGHIIWCKDINKIEASIEEAKKKKFKKYIPPKCAIPDLINKYLEEIK
jgi:beta-1,4-N-acetylglucosaminyltransferase